MNLFLPKGYFLINLILCASKHTNWYNATRGITVFPLWRIFSLLFRSEWSHQPTRCIVFNNNTKPLNNLASERHWGLFKHTLRQPVTGQGSTNREGSAILKLLPMMGLVQMWQICIDAFQFPSWNSGSAPSQFHNVPFERASAECEKWLISSLDLM